MSELEKIGVTESKADYKCALSFIDVDGTEIKTSGTVEGVIKKIPRGSGGFGYDPYFYIDDTKTMAELTPAEKNSISHRGAAVRKMLSLLKERLQ